MLFRILQTGCGRSLFFYKKLQNIIRLPIAK